MTELKRVKKFARQAGYSDAEFITEWKGMRCYDPKYRKGVSPRTGLPYFILVIPQNGEMRYSDDNETMEIYDFVTQ